jgi:CubicO group peptidase (beta-lactamase class C family)
MSYEQLVLKKIAQPLGMTETKITLTAAEKKRLAKGHYDNGSIALYGTPQTQAAGALRSSVSDMLKYIRYHLNEGDEVIRLSHQTTWGDIKYYASGLNWQMNKTSAGHRRIWQSGGSFGFSSYCVIYPELRLGIVLLSNESDQNSQGTIKPPWRTKSNGRREIIAQSEQGHAPKEERRGEHKRSKPRPSASPSTVTRRCSSLSRPAASSSIAGASTSPIAVCRRTRITTKGRGRSVVT